MDRENRTRIKPLHHQVPVIKVNEVRIHPNADSLEIIPIQGFQAIVKKGLFSVGDFGYYIYPDSVVPEREEYSFLWKDKVIPGEPVPLKYRRIKAVRLRKSWSEGLLLPLPKDTSFFEGEDLSDLLGITHYDPPDPELLGGLNERGPKSPWPRSFKGWLYWAWYRILNAMGFDTPLRGPNERGPKNDKPYYDIENFKNHKDAFQEGEQVYVTEKIHGSQGRYVYQDGHMYAGSRRLWKSNKSKCVWRKALEQNPWIEEWCRNHEGYTLYGEVVPTQGGFDYGCKPGEVKFFVFDILSPDYTWLDIDQLSYALSWSSGSMVPTLYYGPYSHLEIQKLVDGQSMLGNHIREGIVIKPIKEHFVHGIGRLKLKLISNQYLEKQ